MARRKELAAQRRATGEPMAVAGLWEGWKSPEGDWLRTFTVITTDANATARPVHDRMPAILQPVDAQHRPVPVGETGFTTLLTNLANRVQPLIRYDLGDRVRFAPEACECGSALPVMAVGVLVLRFRFEDEMRRIFNGGDGQAPQEIALVLLDASGRATLANQTRSAFSPRVGVQWQALSQLSLHAASYKAFRAPNLAELYRRQVSPSTVSLPNFASPCT